MPIAVAPADRCWSCDGAPMLGRRWRRGRCTRWRGSRSGSYSDRRGIQLCRQPAGATDGAWMSRPRSSRSPSHLRGDNFRAV